MKSLFYPRRIVALCSLFLLSASLHAQINGNGSVLSVNASSATIVDPNLTVGGSANITNMTVQVVSNYYAGDVLNYDVALAASLGVSAEYTTMSGVTGILYFTGTTSPANWQALLRTVSFQNTAAACGPSSRQVSFIPGRILQNLYNGHYYEFVTGSYNWKEARDAAALRSFDGRQGYLATATSVGENNFIWKLMNADAWVGATYDHGELVAAGVTAYADQAAAIGKVYWVTGPEKGTFISSGLGTPVAQNGSYMRWNPVEPNNYGGSSEFYVQLYSQSSGNWNDLPISSKLAMLVEYGGMPGDVPQNISYTRTLSLTNTVGGEILGGNVSVCAGTNSTTLTTTAAVPGVTITRWESSLDNFVTAGTPIAHTGSSYTVTNLTQTTYFRSIANGNSCAGAPSASTKVMVGTTVAGNLTADNISLCNGSSATISLSGNDGNVLKWQVSNDNSNWTDILHTGVVYSTNALTTGNYYYRAQVQNPSCGTTLFTASRHIDVTSGAGTVAGTVSGTTSLCGVTNTGSLTLAGYTGSIVKWQKSVDNGIVWTDISNTSATLSIVNQVGTTKYRAVVKNGSCNTVNSSPATVGHFANAFTWLGSSSTDFGTAANWSCNVPGNGDPILITSTAPHMPLLDQNRTLGNIVFESNTSLGLNGYTLTANGRLQGPSSGVIKGGPGSALILNGYDNLQPIYFDQSIPGVSNYLNGITINKESIITTGGTGHCVATTTSASLGMGITRVRLGSIDKSSTASTVNSASYSNFFNTDSTELNPSTSYTISVTTGTPSYPQNARAWIDWNGDGVFDNSTELLTFSGALTGGSVASLTFTTPAISSVIRGGVKRLRIGVEYSSNVCPPCSGTYGEFEDYKIHFTPMPTATGKLVIGNNLVLDGSTTFTKGLVELGNNDITVSSASTINGAGADSYFVTNGTGRIKTLIPSGQSMNFPVGNKAYNPVVVTNNTGLADNFAVRVIDEMYRNGLSGDTVSVAHVARTWDISKDQPNGGAGVNFQFHWNEGEYVALSNPKMFHHDGISWERLNGTAIRSGNSLTYTGYTGGFSPFAVAEYNFTLPVTWLSFTANRESQGVMLNWSTSQESNTKDFSIQHSADGQQWQEIGVKISAGNSNSIKEYSHFHPTPVKGNNYYRIVQRDVDARSTQSAVRIVQWNETPVKFRLLGNPVSSGTIRVISSEPQYLRLFAADGKLVWQAQVATGTIIIDASRLVPGIYTLRNEEKADKLVILK